MTPEIQIIPLSCILIFPQQLSATCFSHMAFEAAYWLPASHEEERLTRDCVLQHVRELVALRRIEAREQDSWAQVTPPTIQLPDSICTSALQ